MSQMVHQIMIGNTNSSNEELDDDDEDNDDFQPD
jgi:hypothetical protein